MNLSFEELLVLGILGFYLYDSAMMLFFNELVLVGSCNTWSYACPTSRWNIKGKLLYFPNPLTPDRFLLRVTWSEDDRPLNGKEVGKTNYFFHSLRPLGYFVLALLVLMCVILPAVIFKMGTGVAFYITLVSIYLTIIITLVMVYRNRKELCLSDRDILSLAFDSIACPPFAINIVRKIALKHKIQFSPIPFAFRYFSKDHFHQLVHSITVKLEEELELEDDESERSIELKGYREKLIGMVA